MYSNWYWLFVSMFPVLVTVAAAYPYLRRRLKKDEEYNDETIEELSWHQYLLWATAIMYGLVMIALGVDYFQYRAAKRGKMKRIFQVARVVSADGRPFLYVAGSRTYRSFSGAIIQVEERVRIFRGDILDLATGERVGRWFPTRSNSCVHAAKGRAWCLNRKAVTQRSLPELQEIADVNAIMERHDLKEVIGLTEQSGLHLKGNNGKEWVIDADTLAARELPKRQKAIIPLNTRTVSAFHVNRPEGIYSLSNGYGGKALSLRKPQEINETPLPKAKKLRKGAILADYVTKKALHWKDDGPIFVTHSASLKDGAPFLISALGRSGDEVWSVKFDEPELIWAHREGERLVVVTGSRDGPFRITALRLKDGHRAWQCAF